LDGTEGVPGEPVGTFVGNLDSVEASQHRTIGAHRPDPTPGLVAGRGSGKSTFAEASSWP
jgi:hypothetical protein